MYYASYIPTALLDLLYTIPAAPQKPIQTKVILVDDDKERRLILGDRLTAQGYTVLAASNLSTVEKYSTLYKDAAFIASPSLDPEELISGLIRLNCFRNLQIFNLNATVDNY